MVTSIHTRELERVILTYMLVNVHDIEIQCVNGWPWPSVECKWDVQLSFMENEWKWMLGYCAWMSKYGGESVGRGGCPNGWMAKCRV